MRLLSLAIALLVTACSNGSDMVMVQIEDLRLKAGQKVEVLVTFYSNCEGTIVGYHRYKERADRPHYEVSMDCPNDPVINRVFIHENSLRVK
jgi:hypothetical protein